MTVSQIEAALDGRIAVVTGANSGVGRSAARRLAEAGARVVMVCRNRTRGERAAAEVGAAAAAGTVELEMTDLSDLVAVRALASRLLDRFPRIDVLVNNAGVYRGSRESSPQGFEVTMATNHLGHFALTLELLGPLRAGWGRIVNVSSDGHRRGDLRRAGLEAILRGEAWKGGLQAYCDSKLANVLFSFELARRYGADGLSANALHPGVLATRIWNQSNHPLSVLMRAFKPLMKSPDVGGKAVFRLAADPELEGVTARYFNGEIEAKASPAARDEDLAAALWETSWRLTRPAA